MDLVVGSGHSYTQAAGVVFGYANAVNQFASTTTGGLFTVASGVELGNRAIGTYASVVGGDANRATGSLASTSGGNLNETIGDDDLAGSFASISGGYENKTLEAYASIPGGAGNQANGGSSTVGGGQNRAVHGPLDWRADSLFEDF